MILELALLTISVVAPERYAVVVGNNQPTTEALGVLSYADDDAARFAELLSANGVEVELLSVFDEATQRVYPDLVKKTRPPTKRELDATLERLFARIGPDSELYFFFAGHGQVRDNGQGVIHFLDGELSRAELYRRVVAPSPSKTNHLIIDACNAYFMVAARGDGEIDYRSLVKSFVAQESLDRYPNTGVIVSTVGDVEVHEWSKVQAGVFSHQLRSALSGAADANRDGAIDYREVEAFLAAANGKVDDPRARVRVFARPPKIDLSAPLLAPAVDTPVIQVPRQWRGRFHVEDDRGVRFAEFNKTDEVPITLRVVPRPHYYIRNDSEELRVVPNRAGVLSRTDFQPITLASRGSVQDTYGAKLFGVPFGPNFVAGYAGALAGRPLPLAEEFIPTEQERLRPYTQAAWITAAVGGGLALSFELASRDATQEYERAAGSPEDVVRFQDRANRYRGFAIASAGIAVAAAITAGVLTWLE